MKTASILRRSVAAKVIAVVVLLLITELTVIFAYYHYNSQSLAEDILTEQVKSIADSHFDGINKLMLTGAMDQRASLQKEMLTQPNILEARVIRSDLVRSMFGDGLPDEIPADDLDRQALQGQEVAVFSNTEKGRKLTLIRAYKASTNTRGANCLQCHVNAKEGDVLGAIRISYDLNLLDKRLGDQDMISMALHVIMFALGLTTLYLFLQRFVTTPLSRLTSNMSKAEQESDLTVRIPVHGQDEFCNAASSFNSMLERFAEIVHQVQGGTTRLGDVSSLLTSSTARSESGVQRQLADTEQIAQQVDRLANTAQSVAGSIQTVASSATGANEQAGNGAFIATEALGSMEAMAEGLKGAVNVIERLDSDTRDIGRMLGLIREIAEQTNLLALNAAIEAARAGEQGRGFAVVADEVRNLSQRTQSATGEIEGIVIKLQSAAQEAVGAIKDAENRTQDSVTHVENTAMALAEISGAVSQINSMTAAIATHAGDQCKSASTIRESIQNISQVARNSVTDIQELHRATDNLARMSEELRSQAQQFKS